MLTETLDHLEGLGFVRDEKVWTAGIVEKLRELLLDRTVTAESEIEERAQTKSDLRLVVLGSDGADEIDAELDDLIGRLLQVGPKGAVQRSLGDGLVLCSATIMRQVIDGEPPARLRGARFVTDNPDLAEAYLEIPAIEAATRKTVAANEILELAGRRMPVLATRRPVLARRAQEQLALAIPIEAT